jgi:integrase
MDEVDLDKKLWTVSAARMKTNKEHIVPLSDAALAILKRQATVRTGDYLFPGRGAGKPSYVNFATGPKTAGFDAGAPHSWRSIFRDAAEDKCGVRRETAEACLAHSLGAVEGAYRRETGVETRRGAMTAYAAWLMDEGKGNVVAFPARA